MDVLIHLYCKPSEECQVMDYIEIMGKKMEATISCFGREPGSRSNMHWLSSVIVKGT